MPRSNQKEKKEPGGKSCLGSSKKAGKAIVKALWWSIIIITACYGLGRGIGQGITDKLVDNGEITILTIFESPKIEAVENVVN